MNLAHSLRCKAFGSCEVTSRPNVSTARPSPQLRLRLVRLLRSALVVVPGVFVTIAVASTPASASGNTWYATVGGSGTSCTSGSPCTLTEALSKAANGDTVDLAAGTYEPASDTSFTINSSITVQPTTPGSTVILEGNGNTVLVVSSPATATVLAITVEVGTGGIYNDGGTLTLEGSTITTNAGAFGGIYNSGTLTVEGSSAVQDNTAAAGYAGGITNYTSGTLIVNDSVILNNTGGANNPGGINNYAGTATIEDSTISDNSAGSSSVGGIFNNGTLTVEHDSIITDNSGSADYVGGLDNDGTATVEDSPSPTTAAPAAAACSTLAAAS